jgi:head decoration protein D
MTNPADLTNQQPRAGGFIESEGEGSYSRDQIVLEGGTGGAGKVVAGTVLGKVTSTGKYLPSPHAASDGSQVAIAILFDNVDATAGDVIAVVIARLAEVRAADLHYDASVTAGAFTVTKNAELAAAGIIVRAP